MRRTIGAALVTIGMIVALMAIALATIWKPTGLVTASITPDGAYVRTAPGVLDLVEPTVTVTAAAADGSDVTVAFGTATDTGAWLDGLSGTTITGLKDWDTLAVGSSASASASASPSASATPSASASASASPSATAASDGTAAGPGIADSDMWSEVKTGKKSVEVTYTVKDRGVTSLIAQTAGGRAPEISLSWQTEPDSSPTVAMLLIGIVVAAAGAGLIIADVQEEKRAAARRAAHNQKLARRRSRAAAETSVLTKFDGDITETSRQVQTAATGHTLGAGIFVSSPRAKELRHRELPEEARLIIPEPEEAAPPAHEDAALPATQEDATPPAAQADEHGDTTSAHDQTEQTDTAPRSPGSQWRQRWGLGESASDQEFDGEKGEPDA